MGTIDGLQLKDITEHNLLYVQYSVKNSNAID